MSPDNTQHVATSQLPRELPLAPQDSGLAERANTVAEGRSGSTHRPAARLMKRRYQAERQAAGAVLPTSTAMPPARRSFVAARVASNGRLSAVLPIRKR